MTCAQGRLERDQSQEEQANADQVTAIWIQPRTSACESASEDKPVGSERSCRLIRRERDRRELDEREPLDAEHADPRGPIPQDVVQGSLSRPTAHRRRRPAPEAHHREDGCPPDRRGSRRTIVSQPAAEEPPREFNFLRRGLRPSASAGDRPATHSLRFLVEQIEFASTLARVVERDPYLRALALGYLSARLIRNKHRFTRHSFPPTFRKADEPGLAYSERIGITRFNFLGCTQTCG